MKTVRSNGITKLHIKKFVSQEILKLNAMTNEKISQSQKYIMKNVMQMKLFHFSKIYICYQFSSLFLFRLLLFD